MPDAKLLPADRPENVLAAASILGSGGVVVIPTDTVYGLAASVFQEAAIERIFQVKRRAAEVRVPLLLATAADLPLVAREVPGVAWDLIGRFWPGPLTLILPARRSLPTAVSRGGDTVAVRVPAAKSCLELLQVLAQPLIGTSANISGRPPALTAREAVDQLGDGVDAVLIDDLAVRAGVASTVVDVSEIPVTVRRLGALGMDEIRRAVGTHVPVREQLTVRPGGR